MSTLLSEETCPTDAILETANRLRLSPWIVAILAMGTVLRWAGMGVSAPWYDEAFSLVMTRQGLFEMIRSLTANISPPGWEIVLWFVTRIAGYSETAALAIPFLASAATLWVAYQLTLELEMDRESQAVALGLLALLPFQFWLAQEARVYAIFTLLYTLGILWAIRGRWLGLGAVMGLLLWCHNTAVFYVPVLILIAALRHPRAWKSIAVAVSVAVIAWSPWLPLIAGQSGSIIPWLPPFTLTHLANNLQGAFFAGTLVGGWQLFGFLAVFLGALLALWRALGLAKQWFTRRASNAERSYLLLMIGVLGPFVMLVSCAALVQNVFIYRTLSPLVPAWIAWLAPTLVFWKTGRNKSTLVRAGLGALWTWVMIAALVGWSPTSKGSDLPQTIGFINAEWQPGDIIYHATGTSAVNFWYYLPEKSHYLIDEISPVGRGITDVTKLPIAVEALESIPHQRAWVVWSRDESLKKMKSHVDDRMAGYVRDCQLVNRVFYWQVWTTEVYLCGPG
jgi:hypothetical protein